ncbi:MAG: hypothetical protein KDD35_12810, partial [Bdellovibrionales bacterium]|nr:hypothetical protein [Bdellovibrionales bacterium]
MKQRMIPIVAFSIFLLMLTFQQCGVDFRPKLNELSRMGFEDPHDKGPLGEGNVPTGGEQYQLPSYTPRIGDRRYISSKLQNIFIDATNTNNAANTAVQGLITANIMKKSSFFGGSCTYNDSLSCRGEGVVATDLAAVLPSSSPTRQGLRINTCRTIAGIDGAIVSALGN